MHDLSQSFFEQERRRRRQTILFVLLGIVWMAILGWIAVAANSPVITFFFESNPSQIRKASVISSISAVVLWMCFTWVLICFGSRLVPMMMGAHPARTSDVRDLNEAVECMHITALEFTNPPRWYVIESDARNAFAFGTSVGKGSVVVTRGLLNALHPEELQAVVAHEIAHLRNGDSRFLAIALAFVWIILLFGTMTTIGVLIAVGVVMVGCYLLIALVSAVASDEASGAIALIVSMAALLSALYLLFFLGLYAFFAALILGMLALGIKAVASAISKSREYLADACAAQWTRNPLALGSALAKISGHRQIGGFSSRLIAPLWLDDAGSEGWVGFLLKSHPPMEQRLAHIRNYAGSSVHTHGQWLREVRPTFVQRFMESMFPVFSTMMALLLTLMMIAYWGAVEPAQIAHVESPENVPLEPSPTGNKHQYGLWQQQSTLDVSPSIVETQPTRLPGVWNESPFPGERHPETRTHWLENHQISHMSRDATQYAINEMFARHGAAFGREDVRRTFEKFGWYRPRLNITFDAIENEFSDLEKNNLRVLAEHRSQAPFSSVRQVQQHQLPHTRNQESSPPPPRRTSPPPALREADRFDHLDRY